VTMDGEGGL